MGSKTIQLVEDPAWVSSMQGKHATCCTSCLVLQWKRTLLQTETRPCTPSSKGLQLPVIILGCFRFFFGGGTPGGLQDPYGPTHCTKSGIWQYQLYEVVKTLQNSLESDKFSYLMICSLKPVYIYIFKSPRDIFIYLSYNDPWAARILT